MPIGSPPIDNGVVVVRKGKIETVDTWVKSNGTRNVVDLGEVVLLPGLINAHCHLDYTDMAGQLPPTKTFTDWIKAITEFKAGWELSDYEESWRSGAEMLIKTGTTTVADIEAVPDLLPQAWSATPLKVISFIEMIGMTARRPPEVVLREALKKASSLRARSRLGLSPHAPYSTVPALLRLCARASERFHWPVCMHLAESRAEYDMFMRGKGPMFDWISKSGRDMSDCGQCSPVEHARRNGLLSPRLIAVHMNYPAQKDADKLGRAGAHVVHCPRSHEYFGHERFPLNRLLRAGVNVCLGTDSLASVLKERREAVELSMFDEMRTMLKRNKGLSPKRVLLMATTAGAKALGLEGKAGVIAPGVGADLIAVPIGKGRIEEQIAYHRGPVAASMIAGTWVLQPAAIRPRAFSRRKEAKRQ